MFDGNSDLGDLHATLVRLTGDVRAGEAADRFASSLSSGGFLEDDAFVDLRTERHQAFAKAPVREAVHAGGAYPETARELHGILAQYLDGTVAPSPRGLVAIAAPHVSPEGGHESYRAAYGSLGPDDAQRTFVILGTSHYGEPETFGLTTKPFLTPLGQAETNAQLARSLADSGGPSVRREDYFHSVEHSIEFQVVFLQHLFGPGVGILPILCGPFARATYQGGRPEDDPAVGCFFEALAGLAKREGDRLLFVLGIDLAHMGRRYGDAFTAHADQGAMVEVGQRDQERLARVLEGDAAGFWDLLRQQGDDLKWCGASPLYTFLRTFPGAKGELLRYQQWNIDDDSVVSFAGLAFRQAAGS